MRVSTYKETQIIVILLTTALGCNIQLQVKTEFRDGTLVRKDFYRFHFSIFINKF